VQSNAGITEAKDLYINNCAQCHGNDGKLGAFGAKDLTATQMDVAEIKKIILEGKGVMPKAAVDETQAAAIAEYVNGSIKGH
jgi:mono/diheme cytochrome c family protein